MPGQRDANGRFIKGAGKVTDVDKGWKKRKAQLEKAAQTKVYVSVGIIEGDKPANKGELTMAELGEIHEFGLGVPRRSFICDWFDQNQSQMEAQMRALGVAVGAGKKDLVQGLSQYGALYAAQIQKRIAENIPPPLAEATIKRKGSSVALIDTGQLRSSITWHIFNADESDAGIGGAEPIDEGDQ